MTTNDRPHINKEEMMLPHGMIINEQHVSLRNVEMHLAPLR